MNCIVGKKNLYNKKSLVILTVAEVVIGSVSGVSWRPGHGPNIVTLLLDSHHRTIDQYSTMPHTH